MNRTQFIEARKSSDLDISSWSADPKSLRAVFVLQHNPFRYLSAHNVPFSRFVIYTFIIIIIIIIIINTIIIIIIITIIITWKSY